MRRLVLFVIAMAVAASACDSPATPAKPAVAPGAAAKPAAPAAKPAAAAAPAADATFVYQPGGRRDPFLSLVGGGLDPRAGQNRRAEGPAGLTTAEIVVSGILQSQGALVAMIKGPDKKTYLVHQGDKLVDGTIKSITPQGLVIVQEVTDPLSLVKQREIKKLLRSLEDAKE